MRGAGKWGTGWEWAWVSVGNGSCIHVWCYGRQLPWPGQMPPTYQAPLQGPGELLAAPLRMPGLPALACYQLSLARRTVF